MVIHDPSSPRPAVPATAVVRAQGDLDLSNLEPLANRLRAAAASSPVVILDAADITFGDSSFLRILIEVARTTELRVAAPRPALRRLIEMVGLDAVLKLHDSVEEARAVPAATDEQRR